MSPPTTLASVFLTYSALVLRFARYIQTGSLWPGTSVSRVAHRDPSSPDGGAQNSRDDAAFDGNKAAQALAVAKRAEQQALDVARKVSQARSEINDRLDGLNSAINELKKSGAGSQSNAAQNFRDSIAEQLSKFRGEFKVIEQKVTSVGPLADTVQSQVFKCRDVIRSAENTLFIHYATATPFTTMQPTRHFFACTDTIIIRPPS